MRTLRKVEDLNDSARPLRMVDGAILAREKPDHTTRQTLLLIDSEKVSRDSLVRLVANRCPDISVDCASTVDGVLARQRPDIVLLDIKSAGIENPEVFRQIMKLRALVEDTPILILSDCASGGFAETALKLGISGCIPYSLGMNVIDAAVRLVLLGGSFFPRESIRGTDPQADAGSDDSAPPENVARSDLPSEHVGRDSPSLTCRECDVVAKLREGKPNKIIAYELGMSISTVKVHIRNIMRKLGATNRMQVALNGLPADNRDPLEFSFGS